MRVVVFVTALALSGTVFAQQQASPAPATSQTQPTLSPATPPGARTETPAPASAQFKAMDRNNDGLVSSGEFEDVARAMFDAMDGDGNGTVSLEELEKARARLDARLPALSSAAAARKVRELDANADGAISRGEHKDAATALFGAADQDKDGNLTTQEFDSRYAELMAQLAA